MWVLDGHDIKNLSKYLWRWELDRRSDLFSPPAHLCAVIYMTEISLIVTLNNQFTSPVTAHSAIYIYISFKSLKYNYYVFIVIT